MRYVFLLGQAENAPTIKEIHNESASHRDILQGPFLDTYQNLTQKSLFMLQWFDSYCSDTTFLMKVDDNVHVNLPLLLAMLYTTDSSKNIIIGSMKEDALVVRKSMHKKWYVPESVFAQKKYPTHVHGPAYIIPSGTVQKLSNICGKIPVIHIEDVFITGICASNAGAKIIDDPRICQTISKREVTHFAISCATEHRPGLKTLWAGMKISFNRARNS